MKQNSRKALVRIVDHRDQNYDLPHPKQKYVTTEPEQRLYTASFHIGTPAIERSVTNCLLP
jgi:hypothetical protein